MRRSSATSRSSSRRRISACANGSRARSASAGPRQRARASRRIRAASPVVRSPRRRGAARSAGGRAGPGSTGSGSRGLGSRSGRAGARAFRSWETWYWSAFEAARGGCVPQSSSISRSAETTSLAEVSSRRAAPEPRSLEGEPDDRHRRPRAVPGSELHACPQAATVPAHRPQGRPQRGLSAGYGTIRCRA